MTYEPDVDPQGNGCFWIIVAVMLLCCLCFGLGVMAAQ